MKIKFLLLLSVLAVSVAFIPDDEPRVELIIDAKAICGEGSLWHPKEKKLYWVDIESHEFHIYDPKTKKDARFVTGERVGTVVPIKKSTDALVALQNGIHRIDTKTGKLTFFVNPITQPDFRFNDGKCDPAGRFWVGTQNLQRGRRNVATLYRIDKDRSVHNMVDSVGLCNGIVWSLDKKKMYFIDTQAATVSSFDYDDKTGDISNRKIAIQLVRGPGGPGGSPDGMTIDSEGKLWIAIYGGGCVTRWDPETGSMLQKITVPAPNVTSCAFGGEDLDVLYITTARQGMNEERLKEFPAAGGLFAVKLNNIKGIPANYYQGK